MFFLKKLLFEPKIIFWKHYSFLEKIFWKLKKNKNIFWKKKFFWKKISLPLVPKSLGN